VYCRSGYLVHWWWGHLRAVLFEVPGIADQGGYNGGSVEVVQEENGLDFQLRECFVW
jgi:hypothetical protein